MLAICINRSQNRFQKNHHFIIGKKYTYGITKDGVYFLMNERGRTIGFSKWQFDANFNDISELRLNKLEELGI